MDILPISIKEHIDTDYKQYALYVIQQRGIPNFYDSMTPVQRLILQHTPEKFQTTVSLVGSVMSTGLYHHGDGSLTKSINKLARTFGCSMPLLQGDGFFGSPVNPKPASSRYTKVKADKVVDEFVRHYKNLNVVNEEGSYDWLHVDLPFCLCTHVIGIAVGYRSNILPRKLDDMRDYLNGKDKPMKPYFAGFKGSVKKYNNLPNGWLISGEFSSDDSAMTIRVGDLPPMVKYSTFLTRLNDKLALYGDHCKLDNNSQKTVDITIKWTDKDSYKDVREAVEKLTKVVVMENIIFIKDGSVLEYSDVKDYLDEFKVHREHVIYKKMRYDLGVNNFELDFLKAKLEFLLYMLEKKRNNQDIKNFLAKFSKKISDRLDGIKLTSLTSDTVKVVTEQIKDLEALIKKSTKDTDDQLRKYKTIKSKFVSKGKINMKGDAALFEVDDLNFVDGIELYDGTEDVDGHDDEDEDDSDDY